MKIAIFGTGATGKSIAELAAHYGHTVVAFGDAERAVVENDGVNISELFTEGESNNIFTNDDGSQILNSNYDVFVEASDISLEGTESSLENVKEALDLNKDVVLANYGPVAKHFDELQLIEQKSDGKIKYGAVIGGSLPIIPLIYRYGPSDVTAIRGVFNEPSNFILSRMDAEKLSYEHVLSEAKGLGITEEGSSSDIDGTDTAAKCASIANILSSHDNTIIDESISFMDVNYEGIKDIPGSLFELAAQDGRTIRLIGEVRKNDVRANPRLVDKDSALSVEGARSTIQIETEQSGTITFSGSEPRGSATASAVYSEVNQLDN